MIYGEVQTQDARQRGQRSLTEFRQMLWVRIQISAVSGAVSAGAVWDRSTYACVQCYAQSDLGSSLLYAELQHYFTDAVGAVAE